MVLIFVAFLTARPLEVGLCGLRCALYSDACSATRKCTRFGLNELASVLTTYIKNEACANHSCRARQLQNQLFPGLGGGPKTTPKQLPQLLFAMSFKSLLYMADGISSLGHGWKSEKQ